MNVANAVANYSTDAEVSLVGRANESARLQVILESVVLRGEIASALVLGSAGCGKSTVSPD